MRLFIAEKPSLARAIANGLGRQEKGEGCITCGNDIVTWCFGHMLEQAWPQDYDPGFAKWKRDNLPIIPAKWANKVKKEAASQLKIIGKLLKDAESVVNAGDPDREGQLLVDEVLEHFGYQGKTERIWLASLDDLSVKKAIEAITDNSRYAHLRDSALARARADWLVGINATRAMTIKGREHGRPDVLSLGRVQTPTLAIIVGRDREIDNFRPVDHFTIKGVFQSACEEFAAALILEDGGEGQDTAGRLVDADVAKAYAEKFKGQSGEIIEANYAEKSKAAPLPHCLSSLQKAASAKLGMSAQEVLETAQKLYEQKLTTYPRTDCRYLPEEQFAAAPDILKMLSSVPGLEKIAAGANTGLKSSAWNTKKVTAHHAIIPTGENVGHLSQKERDLYMMIATAYCLQFYPAMLFEAQKIILGIENAKFEATGRNILVAGWTAVFEDDEDKPESPLPMLKKGDKAKCVDTQIQKKKTSPPARFTEGTIIEAMANVHRFVADKEAKTTLKDAKGIGTEATRAKVLETLKERKYITTEKKALVATQLGREVIDLCPHELKDPITTAEWEARLEAIANGEESLDGFLNGQKQLLPDLLKAILGDAAPEFPCPSCGAALCRRKNKKGNSWFWACSAYPDCKTTLPDDDGKPGQPHEHPVLTEYKCPDCGNPLRKLKSATGEFFGCSGYPGCKRTFPITADGKPDFNHKPAQRKK